MRQVVPAQNESCAAASAYPAGAQQADVPGRVVRRTPHLVQRPVVRRVQRARRAVRRHTRRTAGRVDVTGLGRSRPRSTRRDGRSDERAGHECDRRGCPGQCLCRGTAARRKRTLRRSEQPEDAVASGRRAASCTCDSHSHLPYLSARPRRGRIFSVHTKKCREVPWIHGITERFRGETVLSAPWLCQECGARLARGKPLRVEADPDTLEAEVGVFRPRRTPGLAGRTA